jgi:hypothetical protein
MKGFCNGSWKELYVAITSYDPFKSEGINGTKHKDRLNHIEHQDDSNLSSPIRVDCPNKKR